MVSKVFIMKSILYATDYSQYSVAALKYAHSISEKFDAQLFVMHVFDTPLSLASPTSITYNRKESQRFLDHQTRLENFCVQHLGDEYGQAHPRILVAEDGSVVNGILEKALESNADLIVIGTKGASPIREYFLGSTTKGLIGQSTCPVLAVPAHSRPEMMRTFVYASDFEQADILAIQQLLKIASGYEAHIKVVHITNKHEYAGDQQMEWFKEMLREKVAYDKMDFELIFSDQIMVDLKRYLKSEGVDLLVMLERKEDGFLSNIFEGDLVKKMGTKTPVPLLSYRRESL